VEPLNFRQKAVELIQIENRLGHSELRTGIHLPRKARQLPVEIMGRRVHSHAHDETRGLSQRISTRIESVVQTRNQISEADAVDIENGRRFRVRTHLRRVTGDDQQVMDPGCRSTQKVGQHSQQIAVAAGIVNHRLQPDLPLDHEGGQQCSHPALGPRPVRHIHGINAGGLQQPYLVEHGCRINTLGWHDFDCCNELPRGELGPQSRSFPEGKWLQRDGSLGDSCDSLGVSRRDALNKADDGLDVLRDGAAATANEPGAGFDHPAGVAGHVLG
jgi:hypothetical protein